MKNEFIEPSVLIEQLKREKKSRQQRFEMAVTLFVIALLIPVIYFVVTHPQLTFLVILGIFVFRAFLKYPAAFLLAIIGAAHS